MGAYDPFFYCPPRAYADSHPRADKPRTLFPLSNKSAKLLQISRHILRTRRLRCFPRMPAAEGINPSSNSSFMMAQPHHLAPSITSQISRLLRLMWELAHTSTCFTRLAMVLMVSGESIGGSFYLVPLLILFIVALGRCSASVTSPRPSWKQSRANSRSVLPCIIS